MPGYEVIGAEEKEAVVSIFDEGGGILFRHGFESSRGGSFKVKDFEEAFQKRFCGRKALAVTSGTAALRVALAALGIGPGDEVLVPAFTFVATYEAVIEAGAKPIVVDVDSSLNMDPTAASKKISKATKAILVVHMLGTPADMVALSKISHSYGIALIEDVAWGCGGSVNGISLGCWGDAAAFSFDFAKTITTGEGGMVLFQRETDWAAGSAWHDHGHENNPNVPRWEDTRSGAGFNFRMSELQGAVGLVQLSKLDYIINKQRGCKNALWDVLSDFNFTLRSEPDGSNDTADALVFYVEDRLAASNLRSSFLEDGISTKILPEATKWHFAGDWSHMRTAIQGSSTLESDFQPSRYYLEKAVALPCFVNPPDNFVNRVYNAAKRVYG